MSDSLLYLIRFGVKVLRSEQSPVDFHVGFADEKTLGFVGVQLRVEGLKSLVLKPIDLAT